MVSISQITKCNICFVIFFPIYWVFQDLQTEMSSGMVISTRMYYRDDEIWPTRFVVSYSNYPLQWYQRFEHPFLKSLRLTLPAAFSISILVCESSKLDKYHTSYPSRVNKHSIPFEFVHCNVLVNIDFPLLKVLDTSLYLWIVSLAWY